MDAQTKTCTRCERELPLADYAKQTGGRMGRLSVCRECKKVESREAARTGRWPSFTLAGQRSYRLRKTYGITTEQYNRLLAAQGGACALCGTADTGIRKNLVVDHHHASGHIRGILCDTCNMWLGNYEQLLSRAGNTKLAAYLQQKDSWIVPVFTPRVVATTKICKGCHQEKSLDDFTLSNAEGRYRKARCKECEAARVKKYYATNEAYREATKARAATHDRRKRQVS